MKKFFTIFTFSAIVVVATIALRFWMTINFTMEVRELDSVGNIAWRKWSDYESAIEYSHRVEKEGAGRIIDVIVNYYSYAFTESGQVLVFEHGQNDDPLYLVTKLYWKGAPHDFQDYLPPSEKS